MILAWTGDELWYGQAQNGVKFDHERHCRLLHKTIGILTKVFLHPWSKDGDPSLNGSWATVRTRKWLTHRLMDAQTQATTIPEGQNWPQVKTVRSTRQPTTQHKHTRLWVSSLEIKVRNEKKNRKHTDTFCHRCLVDLWVNELQRLYTYSSNLKRIW